MPLCWIDDTTPLPPTTLALGPDSDAPGLLAAGGSVTPQRLDEAYRLGVFPWYSPGDPPLWWSPDPRMVLPVAQARLSHTLRKTLRRFRRSPGCEIRIDHAFRQVMAACAQAPRDGQAGTWIAPEMIDAYSDWHAQGTAHSFETWQDGELTGGLYGVGLGRMFYGESMFARRTDASKIALAALLAFCRGHGITLNPATGSGRDINAIKNYAIPTTLLALHNDESATPHSSEESSRKFGRGPQC